MQNFSKVNIHEIAENAISNLLDNDKTRFLNDLRLILDSKCSFHKLDLLGKSIGYALKDSPKILIEGFDKLIEYNKMGSYVISSQGLIQLLPDNIELVMEKSRDYILFGNKWYVCDIIGERSVGQSLVDYFEGTLPWIEDFLADENSWIKRTAGVSIHFFSKRIKNDNEKTLILLKILEPYMGEKQIDIVKGIGWGLKTIGKYHPDLIVSFMRDQLDMKKKISKIILRKAMTYLPDDKKEEIKSYV